MLRTFVTVALVVATSSAAAIHLDVAVSRVGNKLATDFCLDGGPACDDLPVLALLGVPEGTVPVDIETGKQIFVSDFNDFEGGPNSVDDPGFISGVGKLPAGRRLSYRAVGRLMYWNPNDGTWTNDVPGTTRIELFGGLSEGQVQVNDPIACGGPPICLITTLEEGSTLFTKGGIAGNPTLIVGDTNASGQLHVHMDWFLENGAGVAGGPAGAYMVELQLTAPGLIDSDPFMIMFSKDLTTAQYGQALAARIIEPSSETPSEQVPLPGIAIVTMAGALAGIAVRRRRRAGRT